MSDDNNTNVQAYEDNGQAEKAKTLRRRSSIGRFFDGIKSLLALGTSYANEEESNEEQGNGKEEEIDNEDTIDVDGDEIDPLAEEVDSLYEKDEFLDDDEEVVPDPEHEKIKKMNISKKEKIALIKQRSEELLEEAIKKLSQDEFCPDLLEPTLDDLNKAHQLEPNDAVTLKLRGDVKQKLGNYLGAIADLNQADTLKPNDAFILRTRGASKFMVHEYHRALEDFNNADKLEPSDSFTLKYRGATKFMLDDFQGALDDLNIADKMAQNDEFILKYRGATKYMLDDLQGALNDLTLADKLKPNEAWILIRLGITKETLGDYHGALDIFNKACTIKSDDILALKYRAITKYHLKDYLGSEADFTRALSIAPGDNEVKDWLLKFKKPEEAKQVHSIGSFDGENKWQLDLAQIKFSSPLLIKIRDKISANTNQQGRIILGQGGFGAVYLVEFNKTLAAMKQVIAHKANEKEMVQDFRKECKLLRALRHPNVIFFLGACLKPDNMFFLTEYMEHGDLFTLIADKDQNLAWENVGKDIALQIAQGLHYLHSNKIIHRDLKSLNILIGRGYVAKIADVGLAKTKTQTATALTTSNRPMTLFWASPEQMDIDQTVSFPSDIFSFGTILWELISQQKPYSGITDKQLMMAIAKEKPIDTLNPIPAHCPKSLADLIKACWNYDPKKRPTAEQCIDILSQN